MARKVRRRGGEGSGAEWWERWQFAATIVRIVLEIVEIFDRGGPGGLL